MDELRTQKDSQNQSRVFKNIDDLQKVLDEFNQNSEVKYKTKTTDSSVIVSCEDCDLYSMWFRNEANFQSVKKGGKQHTDIQFFRSINAGHFQDKHQDLDFTE